MPARRECGPVLVKRTFLVARRLLMEVWRIKRWATRRYCVSPPKPLLSSPQPVQATIAELGLMTGAADPMMLFPAGTTFTPYSGLRNVGNAPLSLTPTIGWMEGATARSAQLPKVSLQPRQTRSLDMPSILSSFGPKNFNGSFNLVFEGLESGPLKPGVGLSGDVENWSCQCPKWRILSLTHTTNAAWCGTRVPRLCVVSGHLHSRAPGVEDRSVAGLRNKLRRMDVPGVQGSASVCLATVFSSAWICCSGFVVSNSSLDHFSTSGEWFLDGGK